MAPESSLLQKWHPAYQHSASGIPLKMARRAKQRGGGHPHLRTPCPVHQFDNLTLDIVPTIRM